MISASYHNPLWVAERAVQLDHMTKGRFILGLGPGALPSDAAMIGLDMPQTRELLEDAVDIITRLMRSDDPVTFDNGRWQLQDARLHLRPYTHPHPEIAIAAVASPAGPRLAGRYGHGLLSIGATTAAGFDVLGLHWDVMEERAAHYGVQVDRNAWRLVGLMHLAETREQAYLDVEHGMLDWFDYFQHTAAFPQMAVGDGTTVRECIDFINETGLGCDRHAGRRHRPDRTSRQAVQRRLRRVPHPRPRLGGAGRQVPQLRAVRPPRRPGVPGPGVLDAGVQGPRPCRPPRARREQPEGGGVGDGQVPVRARRQVLDALTTAPTGPSESPEPASG